MDLVLQATCRRTPARTAFGNVDAGEGGGGDGKHQALGTERSGSSPCSKGFVLLVDDDPAVRETLAELLDDVGFHASQAADATAALTILRRGDPVDVLVTDLTMPGDDGISLIRQARAIRCDLPAVLLTGYAEQVTSVTTMAGGNFHVLRKPVESGRLIQQIELLVSRPSR